MKTVRNIIALTMLSAMIISLASTAQAAEAGQQQIVNINTASAAELEALPGIGPSKSQAIIDYRSKHPFAKIEDIMRVKGIGRKSFLKLKPFLTVSGSTHAPEKSPAAQR